MSGRPGLLAVAVFAMTLPWLPARAGGIDGMAERVYAPGTGFPGARHSDVLAARVLAALPPAPAGWMARDETEVSPDLTSMTGAMVVRREYRQRAGGAGMDLTVALGRNFTQAALMILPDPALRDADGEPVALGDGQDGVLRTDPARRRGLLTAVIGSREVVVVDGWQVAGPLLTGLANQIDIATLRALGGEYRCTADDLDDDVGTIATASRSGGCGRVQKQPAAATGRPAGRD